jgi:hypothetical protein
MVSSTLADAPTVTKDFWNDLFSGDILGWPVMVTKPSGEVWATIVPADGAAGGIAAKRTPMFGK